MHFMKTIFKFGPAGLPAHQKATGVNPWMNGLRYGVPHHQGLFAQRPRLSGRGASLLIFGMCVLFVGSLYGARASTFRGPGSPPPAITNLDAPLDFSDFVSKLKLSSQTITGPVEFFNNGAYPAWLGYTNGGSVNVGVLGIGKSGVLQSYIPTDPFPFTPTLGVYGYAENGSPNLAVYGYSESGSGVVGLVTGASDVAGKFWGRVNIDDTQSGAVPGKLTVENVLTANQGMYLDNPSAPALQYVSTSGYQASDLILGTATGGGSGVGAYGWSTASFGVTVTAVNDAAAAYASAEGPVGMYGYSQNGPGILADVTNGGVANHTNARGVWAESLDYGLYGVGTIALVGNQYLAGNGVGVAVNTTSGVGVYACGTQTAATFNGDVKVFGSLNMGVSSETYVENSNNTDTIIGKLVTPQVTMTEADLLQLYALAGITP